MPRALLSILFCLTILPTAWSQLGGQRTFAFLNLPPSARVTALGGHVIAVVDDDINLAMQNPALLNPLMHQQIAFNHNFHFGDIQNGYAAYGQYIDKLKTTFHAGIQYINYGEFEARDVTGLPEGTFQAGENAIVLGAARPVDERFTVGANLRFVTSRLDVFNSIALSSDIAGVYTDTASRFTATLVFKNIGTQLSPYTEGNFEPLPFEIQFGISKRLQYLPFRFSLIYRHLERWNVTYDDPNQEDNNLFLFGDAPTEESRFVTVMDNFFRHVVFNGEFLFGAKENFRLRLGYNHLLRREMLVNNFGTLAGFTFGAGIKVNRFRIDYGRMIYHIAGGVNHLSIQTNFREFKK